MTIRIRASQSIVVELVKSGYGDFIGDEAPWGLVDEIDEDVESIITRKIGYNRGEMMNKLNYMVRRGIRVNLDEESVNKMVGFISDKLERYITSGFTQSYESIKKLEYFSYSANEFKPSPEFQKVVSEALVYLKNKSEDTDIFDNLLLNFDMNHTISRELAEYAQAEILKNTGKRKEIRIGGQIKLHPPKITDKDSVNWHFDGDPRFIKILCYLENQPKADGSFSIRSNFDRGEYVGSHIKTIIQSINIKESLKRMPKIRIQDMGIFLLNSHMPMLNQRDIKRDKVDSDRYNIYDPSRFKVIIFKGVECLHRGGNNKQFFRPVFQGILSST